MSISECGIICYCIEMTLSALRIQNTVRSIKRTPKTWQRFDFPITQIQQLQDKIIEHCLCLLIIFALRQHERKIQCLLLVVVLCAIPFPIVDSRMYCHRLLLSFVKRRRRITNMEIRVRLPWFQWSMTRNNMDPRRRRRRRVHWMPSWIDCLSGDSRNAPRRLNTATRKVFIH